MVLNIVIGAVCIFVLLLHFLLLVGILVGVWRKNNVHIQNENNEVHVNTDEQVADDENEDDDDGTDGNWRQSLKDPED